MSSQPVSQDPEPKTFGTKAAPVAAVTSSQQISPSKMFAEPGPSVQSMQQKRGSALRYSEDNNTK